MRIAFVNQPYDQVLPPRQNSIGLIVFNTAIEMVNDAQVTLIGKPFDGTSDPQWAKRYLPIPAPLDNALHMAASRYPRWISKFHLEWLADAHPQYAQRAAAAAAAIEPGIVHLMNYWSWSRTLQAEIRPKSKLVLEMQCEWLSQKDKTAVARQLESVDAIAAVSDHIGNLIRRRFPDYPRPIVTVYNGVNCDVFQPGTQNAAQGEELRTLFVGRVSPEKGVHTLIEAFAQVAQRFPAARLELVGGRGSLPADLLVNLSDDPLVFALRRFYDGTVTQNYANYLDQLVVKLGLQDRVHFAGALPHHELVKAYQNADLVVNPSLSESFGISIVEGMACGKPVIGTRIGGMKETIIDGETGLQVDPERPDLLAQAIVSVLENRDKAGSMGRAGRQRAVEQFSWRARAVRLRRLYDQIHQRPM